ncbi:MAG: methyltransferase [Candidatus Thorarchaeota archaeon]|nr:MAG: methyltransferase [Candidatus Thorarchaeota archaeon]
MRLRDLEMALQSMERLDEREVSLESYPTPASIAASVLFAAEMEHGDIIGKTVLDLGCGDGIFAIGAALLGARHVVGIDIQTKGLKVSQRNSVLLGTEGTTDWVLGDVTSVEVTEPIDTVVSNPPFGVKKRGADLKFLGKAVSIAAVTYSMHLAIEKNREFLKGAIEELNGEVTQIETFQFPIPRIYDFHKKEMHLVAVDLYRVCRRA